MNTKNHSRRSYFAVRSVDCNPVAAALEPVLLLVLEADRRVVGLEIVLSAG